MPDSPTTEDYRRNDFLFILFVTAFNKHSYEPLRFHQICIRYLNELERMGFEIEGLTSKNPSLQTHAIREAIIQAIHWGILHTVNGLFQANDNSIVRYRILKESTLLTEAEKVAAKIAARTASTPAI